MPSDPLLPVMLTSPRTRSPDASVGGGERKRRRKVLSCYDCRRRKLQCDRGAPACGRCQRTGHAATCSYHDDVSEASMRDADFKDSYHSYSNLPSQTIDAGAPGSDVSSRLQYQDRRIKQLEAALAQTGHSQVQDPVQRLKASKLPPTPAAIVASEHLGATLNDHESMLLRGKSFKTQFFGSTHALTLLAHMPDIYYFTKETFEAHPALSRIKRDMRALEERAHVTIPQPRLGTEVDLKALLPARAEADMLVNLYMSTYDNLYHILHLPSFWREYNQLWSNVYTASPHFVALLLLIMASSQCLASTQPWLYIGKCSIARKKALAYTKACDDWIQAQSQKHVTVADFQIRFMLFLAQHVNAYKCKRTWTYSGSLLRFCMAAGLHRSPDLIRKPTSALDKELRRRIWAAVTEVELQASFDRGMIPSPWPMQADCPPPSNINDGDLDQNSEHLPHAKPLSHFTPTSYLASAAESISLRHGMSTSFNSIRQTLTFGDVKRLSEDIEVHLQRVPQWTGPGADMARARLVLQMRQYLIALHDMQIRQADTTIERNLSSMMLVENATKTIDIQRDLINKGCYALEVLCEDQVRAALSICHAAISPDLRIDRSIAQVVQHHASRVMDEAVMMLTDKAIRFGQEHKQLWLTLAAHGYMKSRNDPSQRAAYMQEAVEKIASPYYKMMACQEDAPATPGIGNIKPKDALSNNIINQIPPMAISHDQSDLPSFGDSQILDLDDLAEWTFEDWGFNPSLMRESFVEHTQLSTAKEDDDPCRVKD